MQLADVIFGYSLLYTAGQFRFGLLADRWGARLAVGVGLVASIAANLMMGLAASFGLLLALSACGLPGRRRITPDRASA